MATSPQARVLELLKRFNNGKKVCIDELQNDTMWFDKSEKTIRRDLDVIKEYFPNSFELIRGGKGEKGCYKAITKDVFNNFINKDTLALLVQTFNIAQRNSALKSMNISDADKKILESKIKKSQECYEFITKPYETKKNDEVLLKEMERAIIGKRHTTIVHQERDGVKAYDVKPYKIVFMNENFYLACENTSETYPFSIFRITNIQSVQLKSKTFHTDYDIDAFIKHMQTPFSTYIPNFRQHLIEVKVEVSRKKARFFKAKKHLASQEVLEQEDGSVILTFKVTQELEIEELVKKWIPHMKVVSPLSLKKNIEYDLKEYLYGQNMTYK